MQGSWLKGINSQQLDAQQRYERRMDMRDHLLSISWDVMGFSLGYYNNDYQPIESSVTAFGILLYQSPALPNTASGNQVVQR